MIEVSTHLLLLLLIGALLFIVLILMFWSSARSSQRIKQDHIQLTQNLSQNMDSLAGHISSLSQGQHQLAGSLSAVTQAQAEQQAQTLKLLETRLTTVTEAMGVNLSSSAQRTAQSLGQLQQRLETIDKAQDKITKLSNEVVSLQDILSNKQTRGAFGEIQLNDIVSKALPKDSYSLQATLSNGKRADCLIHLPNPPGPIAIDSKFPLEAYEALQRSGSEQELKDAIRMMKQSIRAHIKAISAKYIIEGETADGALMFIPSEAVYAELHANFSELVREGFDARVWIVSPTTCMATLNTMRAILKDARMKEQASHIRKELGLLHADVERLGTRVGNLDRHFNQARKDVDDILISSEKATKRANRLYHFDFPEDELNSETPTQLSKQTSA